MLLTMQTIADIELSWKRALGDELCEPYIAQLAEFVDQERRGSVPVYPPEPLVFNALRTTPFDKVKVVIVGQDPYHGAGQAHGLAFSVPGGRFVASFSKEYFQRTSCGFGDFCAFQWEFGGMGGARSAVAQYDPDC